LKVGLVGLGKMGYNLGLNMLEHGHQIVAYDVNAALVEEASTHGVEGVNTYAALVGALPAPRVIWLMVPSGPIVDQAIAQLIPHLSKGDIVVDAGNSHYKDSLRRYEGLRENHIHFVDVGTSGGMEGARHGACYMAGGEREPFAVIEPLLRDTAVEGGYLYAGKPGSGHFLKMVHNGIEYGMMAAIGEGFELLEKCEFDYDYEQVAGLFSNGSVIRGWLMELTQRAFSKDADLTAIRGVMHASGEGKWTVETALELEVATPVIAAALLMRYRSKQDDTFTGKVVAALRNEFGGHSVDKA